MEAIIDFFGMLGNKLQELINVITSIIGFLFELPSMIINTLSFLPNEILIILSTALTVIVFVFIYRLIK